MHGMSTDTPERIAVRIDVDAETTRVDFATDPLAALQRAVGGDIESVQLNDAMSMFANEDGIAQFGVRARNVAAEALVLWLTGQGVALLGPVVVTGRVDDEGDTLGLSEEQAILIENLGVFARGDF